jgi:hypothetical protein
MTDLSTANGHDTVGGLEPPVTRPRASKDPTAAARAKRYRDGRVAARKAAAAAPAEDQKTNDFNSSVTVARHADARLDRDGEKASVANGVTPFAKARWQVGRDSENSPATSEHRGTIDLAAYAAAIGLATVAAYFSIRGMAVVFPGAPVAIVIMAATMEAAKLVTAGWLARRWRSTAWIWRLALASLVLGLAVINAGGTYSQLVAAHVGERGRAQASIETQTANLDARIEVAAHTVADLDTRVSQIDSAVAAATQRGRTAGAMSIMDAQRRSRTGLTSEREQAAGTLSGSPQGRTRISGRQRASDRNRGRTDPLRGRAGRHGHRQRAGNPLADRPHGPVLRSARHRAHGSGIGHASRGIREKG